MFSKRWGRQKNHENHNDTGLESLASAEFETAIDAVIKVLKIDSRTLANYLSLGRLLRQQGEIGSAIRLHQHLLSTASLSDYELRQVRLELARVFLKTGLLDRAERLLVDLVTDKDDIRDAALVHLVSIYRDEQEWNKAILAADQLTWKRSKNTAVPLQSHFYCELAEQAITLGDVQEAQRFFREALSYDSKAIRPNLCWGKLAIQLGDYAQGLKLLELVAARDRTYIREFIDDIWRCYNSGLVTDPVLALQSWYRRYPVEPVLLVLVRELDLLGEAASALTLLEAHIEPGTSVPVLTEYLRALAHTRVLGDENSGVSRVIDALERQSSQDFVYGCSICGFAGNQLHWLCPKCKSWDTVKSR